MKLTEHYKISEQEGKLIAMNILEAFHSERVIQVSDLVDEIFPDLSMREKYAICLMCKVINPHSKCNSLK